MTVADTLARPVRTLACSFTVLGEPIPQGSKTAKVVTSKKTNKSFTVLYEDNPRLEPWRKNVAIAARQHVGPAWVPLDSPLDVRLMFTMPKPPSYPKTRRTWPDHSADIDKCARAILDSLKHANVIANDSRFIHLTAAQHFPGEDPEALDEPGVRIAVWTISEPTQPSLLDEAL